MPTFKHLTVKHDAKIKDDLKVSDNLKVKGNLSLAGDQLVGGNLTVNGSTSVLALYSRQPVVALTAGNTANITLTAAQSGTLFTVPAAGSAYSIYLPVPAVGLSYKFVLTAAPGYVITINASVVGNGTMGGCVYSGNINSITALFQEVATATNSTFIATATAGSHINLVAISTTQWQISGGSSIAADGTAYVTLA